MMPAPLATVSHDHPAIRATGHADDLLGAGDNLKPFQLELVYGAIHGLAHSISSGTSTSSPSLADTMARIAAIRGVSPS